MRTWKRRRVASRGSEAMTAMKPPFHPSTAVVRSPAACTSPSAVCAWSPLLHPHPAVKMYLPGAAHPHCTCTRMEVLSHAAQHMRELLASRRAVHRVDQGAGAYVTVGAHSSAVHTAAAQFFAGAVGGASATYSTHWLDTIKVRMQSFPSTYHTCCQCLRTTLHQGGLSALYQGAVPAVIGHTIKASAVFMSYGLCQELVWQMSLNAGLMPPPPDVDGRHELKVWQLASAGALTGIMASFVLCPVELIKCRMQALCHGTSCSGMPLEAEPRLGMICVAKSVFQTDGLRGLYRGLSGMWAKEIPGSFVYFGSYELAKSIATANMDGSLHYSKTTVFLCGVFAGLCFCVTHPIESIKTRVQVTSQSGQQGFIRATVHIIKTEGLKPLCSGLKPSLLRACLYSGVQFASYEMAKDYLLNPSEHHHH